MDTGTKVAVGVGLVGVVGAIGYYALKKSSTTTTSSGCPVASINLSANPTSTEPGGTVTFTAVATDASGNPVEGADVYLYEVTTNTLSSPATTDSTGTVEFSVTFPSSTEPGQYVFEAEACVSSGGSS